MKEIRSTVPEEWADTLASALRHTEDGTIRYLCVVYEAPDGSLAYDFQGYPGARNQLRSALDARAELDRCTRN